MLLQQTHQNAELSQREVARRAGVPQSTLSRIERGHESPRFATLDHLLRECGKELELVPRPGAGVDRTPIRELLRLSPIERLRIAAREGRNLDRLLRAAKRR